jgi:DNA (cytosine-5)-methyltransferase 1
MNLNLTTELSNEAQNPLLRVGAVMPSCLSHGSLFSGIGGFDLAAQWMGWNNIFQCEKDEWCRKVLAKNFPNTKRFEDIKQFNAKEYNGTIDVISGGFPCQPFSVAGQRKGKDDDRYLWEEMLRVIGEVQPKFVVGENVTGIIGMALDTVLSDLEAQNYTTETYIIPACSKNAWHRRDRVWIVAYSNSIGRQDEQKENGKPLCNGERNNTIEEQSGRQQQRRTGEPSSVFANTDNTGCEEQRQPITDGAELFAPKCSSWWETEPGVGRVVDGLPGRVDRLKGLGNAIVPQVAYEIFSAIGAVSRHGA